MRPKTMYSRLFTLLVIFSAGLLFFVACPEGFPELQTGSLRIIHQDQEFPRTIEPEAENITITSYRVSGTGPNNAVLTPKEYDASPIQIDDLLAGTWSITVEGLNDEDPALVVALLTKDVLIESKKTTDSTFTLKYATGTGDASILIVWPQTVESVHDILITVNTTISGKERFILEAADASPSGEDLSLLLNITDLPVGSYDVWVTFRNDTETILGVPAFESLNIYSDQESEGTITFVESMFPVESPDFSPVPGDYSKGQSVSLSTATPGAIIYYTIDGSAPDTDSLLYETPIGIGETTTIRAFATRDFAIPSLESSATYSILHPTPRFSLLAGTYDSPQVVSLSCANMEASIRFTTDGSAPTGSSPVYTTPVAVAENMTIKAVASFAGDVLSNVRSSAYKIKAGAPVYSSDGDTYLTPQSITLTSVTAEATIRYTTDGEDPTSTSTIHSDPIQVNENLTVKAITYKSNMEPSSIMTETYQIRVAAPQFSFAAGTYPTSQSITLTSATSGAVIHYTLDETTPTADSPVYSSPIAIAVDETLKAIALKNGMNASPVSEAVYHIQPAVPTFSVAAGAYAESQTVKLATTTSGAEIRYTLDESTPTTSSLLFSTDITIDFDTVIKAISVKSGMTPSEVATASYFITGTSGLSIVNPINSSVSILWPDDWKGKSLVTDFHGTITASISPEPALGEFSYTWYLDGTEASCQNGTIASTTSTIRFGKHLDDVRPSIGPHSLAVKATKGTKNYSASQFFTVYDNGTAGTAEIVETGITLDENSIKLSENSTKQLTATVNPANATLKDVIWTSSDPELVEVSSEGLVTAHFGWDSSEVTITAETGSKSYSVTCTVSSPQVVHVQSCFSTTLLLKEDGSVWGTGYNVNGEIGDGTNTNRSTPVPTLTGVESIASGDYHSLFLKTDGSLWASGRNDRGQLGDTTKTTRLTPVKIMDDVKRVVAKIFQTFIIQDDGSLWVTGENGWAQLGDGTSINRSTPKHTMDDVQDVFPGEYHTMILKTNGDLYANGRNNYGQLGNSTTSNADSPVHIMSGVKSVAVGQYHTMILKTDGTLWATGDNQYGQLGDGSTTGVTTPKQVMTGVASVYSYRNHTAILKTDGTLYTTGYNSVGQLGDGSQTNRSTPVHIMSDVFDVRVGFQDTVILKTNGTLYGAGAGSFGKFGTGTPSNYSTPIVIMTDVAVFSMPSNYTMIIKKNGSVYGMGSNSSGQLGNGTTQQALVPVKMY